MSDLIIRALDPETDRELLEEAYAWRTVKRLARMPEGVYSFEDFITSQPNKVTLGMLNGRLQSVFLIENRGPGIFEVHFSISPSAKREIVAAGALTIKHWLFEHGAKEIFGWLRESHFALGHPVRRFAESIGFFEERNSRRCVNIGTLVDAHWVWWQKFVARR